MPFLEAVAFLRRHVAAYAEQEPDGLVFIGPRGGAVRESTFGTKVWRPTLRKLNLSHLHCHDLRGFAATLGRLIAAGADAVRREGSGRASSNERPEPEQLTLD